MELYQDLLQIINSNAPVVVEATVISRVCSKGASKAAVEKALDDLVEKEYITVFPTEKGLHVDRKISFTDKSKDLIAASGIAGVMNELFPSEPKKGKKAE